MKPENKRASTATSKREELLSGAVSELQKGVMALADDWLGLIAVEVRLAGISLSLMLALALCGAVFGVAAWLSLTSAGALWMVNQGVGWEMVLLGLAGINAVLALSMVVPVRHLSRNLLFQITRRQVRTHVEPEDSERA
jgi:hypothetical protein